MFSFLGWKVITLAAALALHMVDGAQHLGFKNTVWQPIYGLSEELGTVAGSNVKAANAILAHLETMRKAALRAAIFVEVNAVTEKDSKRNNGATILHAASKPSPVQVQVNRPVFSSKSGIKRGLRKRQSRRILKFAPTGVGLCQQRLPVVRGHSKPRTKLANKAIGSTPCALTPPEVTENTRTKTKLTETGNENMVHGPGSHATNTHQGSTGDSFKCRLLGSGTTGGLFFSRTRHRLFRHGELHQDASSRRRSNAETGRKPETGERNRDTSLEISLRRR
uniref:Variant surface glycoprotein 1829 n=1 Tax=Trypanosoma brucei TaxID=5691 RepID=M4SWG9_9TRYP|nr:variant surface glycoprotein 1829 [Trypanosoma brucei]